ncbi:unnamed protein product [Ostreobium quekettii]|uniref:Prefoldin subunit 2 n=1 Tax=Ostreobium quekettii TaxID=121088 RepID=A0A8S1J6S3_9CHLO|nr:unnamed protein product [Ostreobium quekettii]|eukprot:evm.model.scf_1014.1 EVM.evm.TU.scf_1014.1   scf_1014:1576-4700(+)
MDSAADGEPTSQGEIVRRFAAMREEVNAIWGKMTELSSESSEHDQVIRALEPMAADRKCFRLMGDVLVERTVGEVLPAVKKNHDGIQQVLRSLAQQLETKRKALTEFQTKYKIRVKGEDFEEEQEGDKGSGATSQGVLVSSS